VGPEDLVASAAYQPEPTAAAAARRFVRDTLQTWVATGAATDGHGLVDDAVLLTSELVTNAVIHAGTQVHLTCRLADGAVEVVVRDGHPSRLVPEVAGDGSGPAERTGGRGLLLPAALASAWGVAYGRSSKAVWFRLELAGPGGGLANGAGGDHAADELADAIGVTAALATALRSPAQKATWVAEPDGSPLLVAAAESGYRQLLCAAVESARIAVGADAAFAMMADEDGDLRLRAVSGSVPAVDDESPVSSPSVVTVPFVVDGRVTGLLAAASETVGKFGDPETARLQWLADRSGPALQRAWLGELERIRRGRISALAEARGLLTGGLCRDDIMALAGRATVPRLAPWCAVLTPPGDALAGDALAGGALAGGALAEGALAGGALAEGALAEGALAGGAQGGTRLRTSYARHTDERLARALPWLLDRVCQVAAPEFPARRGAVTRPGRRWPLVTGDMAGAPPEAAELAASTAWCFPLGDPQDAVGVFVIGDGGEDRLPQEVAAVAADLACRVGLALGSAPLVAHKV
jgi:anti-sigma regulatory factor (Ser/Thr protein kinase)